MRNTFVKTLVDIAEKDDNICLITGDLGFGVLNPFIEKFPNRFINAGIAEQNMTGVAAGMAKEGKTVVTYSIGNFPTMRCLEQIRNDCAYHNANVKIVCVGGGFVYGAHGMSHHATEDIAIIRALPEVIVFAPGDLVEAEEVTKAMINYKGTCYLRLGKGGEKRIHEKIENFKIGKAIKISEGSDIAIFSTGAILDEAVKVREELEKEDLKVAEYSFPTVKPIDEKVIIENTNKCKLIVTIEEHKIIGGLGGAVAEVMAENRGGAKLLRIGLNDEYTSIVGTQAYLREQYGISSEKITKRILEKLKEEK